MSAIRKDDRVEVLTGKRQGRTGLVVDVHENRARVAIDGVAYEMIFNCDDLKVVVKASEAIAAASKSFTYVPSEPLPFTGEKKRAVARYLIKTKQMCPSYQYSCTGACGIENQNEETEIQTVSATSK